MMAGMGALFQLMNPEGFSKVDTNKDGGIDLAEFKNNASEMAAQGFTKLDENQDGKVTHEEVEKLGERARSMMGGRGGAGQGGPGGQGGFRRPGGEGAPGGAGFRRPGGEGGEGGGFRRPPAEGGDAKPEGAKKDGAI